MNVIQNYVITGFTNNGNTVLVQRNDSSLSKMLNGSYTRKSPTYNAQSKVYSIPEMSFVVRRDAVHEDAPTGQRASALVQIRLPVKGITSTDVDDLITDLRSYVNDEDLKDNLLSLLLPTCNSCTEEEEEEEQQ